MLGSELWKDDFGFLLSMVKEFLVDLDVWDYTVIIHVLAPSLGQDAGVVS